MIYAKFPASLALTQNQLRVVERMAEQEKRALVKRPESFWTLESRQGESNVEKYRIDRPGG